MFRKPKLTRPQINMLVLLIDRQVSDSLEAMRGFSDLDRRRMVRDYVENLQAIRAKLVRLKCKV